LQIDVENACKNPHRHSERSYVLRMTKKGKFTTILEYQDIKP